MLGQPFAKGGMNEHIKMSDVDDHGDKEYLEVSVAATADLISDRLVEKE